MQQETSKHGRSGSGILLPFPVCGEHIVLIPQTLNGGYPLNSYWGYILNHVVRISHTLSDWDTRAKRGHLTEWVSEDIRRSEQVMYVTTQ